MLAVRPILVCTILLVQHAVTECACSARPAAEKQARRAVCSASVSIFNDSCQTNYLEIYPTDLRQTVGFGRTTAVDDQSEISFSIPQATLP